MLVGKTHPRRQGGRGWGVGTESELLRTEGTQKLFGPRDGVFIEDG